MVVSNKKKEILGSRTVGRISYNQTEATEDNQTVRDNRDYKRHGKETEGP